MANNLCVRTINQEELAKAQHAFSEAALVGKSETEINADYQKRLYPDSGKVKKPLPNLARSASIFADYGSLAVSTLSHKKISSIVYQLQQLNITELTAAKTEESVLKILEANQTIRTKAVHIKVSRSQKADYIQQIISLSQDELRITRRRDAKIGIQRDVKIAGSCVDYDDFDNQLNLNNIRDPLLIAFLKEYLSLENLEYAHEFFHKAVREVGFVNVNSDPGDACNEAAISYDFETDSVKIHLRSQFSKLTLISDPQSNGERDGVDAVSEVVLKVSRVGDATPVDADRPDFSQVQVEVESGHLEILNEDHHKHYVRAAVSGIIEKIRISEPLLANDYLVIESFVDLYRDFLSADRLKIAMENNILTSEEAYLLTWHDVNLAKDAIKNETLLVHLCGLPHARAMISVFARRYDANSDVKQAINNLNEAVRLVDSRQWDKIAWRLQSKTNRIYIQSALSLIGSVVPSVEVDKETVEKITSKQVKSLSKRNMLLFGLDNYSLAHVAMQDKKGSILKKIISPTTNQRFVRWFVRTFLRKKLVRDPLHRLESAQLKDLLMMHTKYLHRALRRGSNAARTFGRKRDVIKHLNSIDFASILYRVSDRKTYNIVKNRLRKDKKFFQKLIGADTKDPDMVLLVVAKYQLHFGSDEKKNHKVIANIYGRCRDDTKHLFYEAWLKQKNQNELLSIIKEIWAGSLMELPDVNNVLKPTLIQHLAQSPSLYLKLLQALVKSGNLLLIKEIFADRLMLSKIVRDTGYRAWLSKAPERELVNAMYRAALAQLTLSDYQTVETLSFCYSIMNQSERQAVLENEHESQILIDLLISNIENLVLFPIFNIEHDGSQLQLLLSHAAPEQARTLLHVLRRDRPHLRELIEHTEHRIAQVPSRLISLQSGVDKLEQSVKEQKSKLPKYTKTKKYKKAKTALTDLEKQRDTAKSEIEHSSSLLEKDKAKLKGWQGALGFSSTLRAAMINSEPVKSKFTADLSDIEAAALLKASPKLFPVLSEQVMRAYRGIVAGFTLREISTFNRLATSASSDEAIPPLENIVQGLYAERLLLANPKGKHIAEYIVRMIDAGDPKVMEDLGKVLSATKIMTALFASDASLVPIINAMVDKNVNQVMISGFSNSLLLFSLANSDLHDEILLNSDLRNQLSTHASCELVAYFIATSSIARFKLDDWKVFLDRIVKLPKKDQQPIFEKYQAMLERRIPEFKHWQFGQLAADEIVLLEGDRIETIILLLNNKQYLPEDLLVWLLAEYRGKIKLADAPLIRAHVLEDEALLHSLLHDVASVSKMWELLTLETHRDLNRESGSKNSTIIKALTDDSLLSYLIQHANIEQLKYLLKEYPAALTALHREFLVNPDMRAVIERQANEDESLLRTIFLSVDFKHRLQMLIVSPVCFDACIKDGSDHDALLLGSNAKQTALMLHLARDRLTRGIITDENRLETLFSGKGITENDRANAIKRLVEISEDPNDLLSVPERETYRAHLLKHINSDKFILSLRNISVERLTSLYLASKNDTCGFKVKEHFCLPANRDLLHRVLLNCSHENLLKIFVSNERSFMLNNPFNIFMALLTDQSTEDTRETAKSIQFRAKQSPSIMRYLAQRADVNQVRTLLNSGVLGASLLRVYAEDTTLIDQLFRGVTSQKLFDTFSQLFLQIDKLLTQTEIMRQSGDKFHVLRDHLLNRYSEALFVNNYSMPEDVAKHINFSFGWRSRDNGANVFFGDNRNFPYNSPEIYFYAKSLLKYPDWLKDMEANSEMRTALQDSVKRNGEGIQYFTRYPSATVPPLFQALLMLSDTNKGALDAEYRSRNVDYEPLVGPDVYGAGSFVRVGN